MSRKKYNKKKWIVTVQPKKDKSIIHELASRFTNVINERLNCYNGLKIWD